MTVVTFTSRLAGTPRIIASGPRGCPYTYLAAAFPFRGRYASLLGRFVVA